MYRFTNEDKLFAMELAKVGHVKFLSSQVTLVSDDKGLQFKEHATEEENRCEGLTLPSNWVIEGIYFRENGISVTFGIGAPKDN